VRPGEKDQASLLDGTPDKRLFWSIISDYDTSIALCELIDNAVDLWWQHDRSKPLRVAIDLDVDRQLITVEDDAGGVGPSDLRFLIAPGGSNNDPNGKTIGVFGVGSKRAAVALAENIVIRTRNGANDSFQIDVTKEWIEAEGWQIPVYRIPATPEGTTSVSLSALRRMLTWQFVKEFEAHLGFVYCRFLENDKFELRVNGKSVSPSRVDRWAYPPDHSPRRAAFDIHLPKEGAVAVEILAGLILDRDPAEDNYGVAFYCNDRLICKHVKAREVGYFTSAVGVPHPDASLARAIVILSGPAKLMPWNSSKSGINFSHPLFAEIAPLLSQLLGHFTSLSRRLKHSWSTDVLRYTQGEIVDVDEAAVVQSKRVMLPALPRVSKTRVEHLLAKNKGVIEDQPWTLGLVEAFAAVDTIQRQKYETGNRIALILLDSNFEIALKEFIVHRKDFFPPSQYTDAAIGTLFKNRDAVLDAVTGKVKLDGTLIGRARHYYMARNKLIHERATIAIPDADIKNYRTVIKQILVVLFGLDLEAN
jgi:hypothetical protein